MSCCRNQPRFLAQHGAGQIAHYAHCSGSELCLAKTLTYHVEQLKLPFLNPAESFRPDLLPTSICRIVTSQTLSGLMQRPESMPKGIETLQDIIGLHKSHRALPKHVR